MMKKSEHTDNTNPMKNTIANTTANQTNTHTTITMHGTTINHINDTAMTDTTNNTDTTKAVVMIII
eukprot:2572056-Pyramimonas_sp.AAC.1